MFLSLVIIIVMNLFFVVLKSNLKFLLEFFFGLILLYVNELIEICLVKLMVLYRVMIFRLRFVVVVVVL